MSLDPLSILLQLVIGGVGFVLFTYGRKLDRLPQLLSGLLFMVLPFLVSGNTALLIVSVILGAATWCAVRLGW